MDISWANTVFLAYILIFQTRPHLVVFFAYFTSSNPPSVDCDAVPSHFLSPLDELCAAAWGFGWSDICDRNSCISRFWILHASKSGVFQVFVQRSCGFARTAKYLQLHIQNNYLSEVLSDPRNNQQLKNHTSQKKQKIHPTPVALKNLYFPAKWLANPLGKLQIAIIHLVHSTPRFAPPPLQWHLFGVTEGLRLHHGKSLPRCFRQLLGESGHLFLP